jgi:integrase
MGTTRSFINLPLYPDCFERFCDESGRVRTPSTREAMLIHLRALQNRHPGKRSRDFTPADLAAYCQSNNAAPATQKTRRSLLQSFYAWATFIGLVKEDPARDLKYLVQPGDHQVRRHTWLSPDEFRRLLRDLPTETMVDRRNRMIVFVGAMTGIRRINLDGLLWSMFTDDLTSLKVTVKRQKLQEYGIPDLLLYELELWRKELKPDQGLDGPVFPAFHFEMESSEEYHMACSFQTPLHHQGIGLAVKRATTRVLGTALCPHDLRRSFAAYLESEGYDVKDIQRALGHENLATTSVYLNRNPDKAVSVGRSLNVRL